MMLRTILWLYMVFWGLYLLTLPVPMMTPGF